MKTIDKYSDEHKSKRSHKEVSENSNFTLPASAPPQDSPWQEREGGRGLLLQRPMGQSPSHLLWRELMDLTCIRNPGSIRSKGEKAADLLWLTGLYEREVKHRT